MYYGRNRYGILMKHGGAAIESSEPVAILVMADKRMRSSEVPNIPRARSIAVIAVLSCREQAGPRALRVFWVSGFTLLKPPF